MPNCFSLTPKICVALGIYTPHRLNYIDECLCNHFGVKVDPKKWLCAWYDFIGLGLATGKTWEEMRSEYKKKVEEWPDSAEFYQDLIQILDYLEENYIPNAWVTIGK